MELQSSFLVMSRTYRCLLLSSTHQGSIHFSHMVCHYSKPLNWRINNENLLKTTYTYIVQLLLSLTIWWGAIRFLPFLHCGVCLNWRYQKGTDDEHQTHKKLVKFTRMNTKKWDWIQVNYTILLLLENSCWPSPSLSQRCSNWIWTGLVSARFVLDLSEPVCA